MAFSSPYYTKHEDVRYAYVHVELYSRNVFGAYIKPTGQDHTLLEMQEYVLDLMVKQKLLIHDPSYTYQIRGEQPIIAGTIEEREFLKRANARGSLKGAVV